MLVLLDCYFNLMDFWTDDTVQRVVCTCLWLIELALDISLRWIDASINASIRISADRRAFDLNLLAHAGSSQSFLRDDCDEILIRWTLTFIVAITWSLVRHPECAIRVDTLRCTCISNHLIVAYDASLSLLYLSQVIFLRSDETRHLGLFFLLDSALCMHLVLQIVQVSLWF